jgi:hypothetical protein
VRLPLNQIALPREKPVRLNDYTLRSVGYVAEYTQLTTDATDFVSLEGTGYFVAIPSEARQGNSYHFFVTAKHVVEHLIGKPIGLLVNKRGGGRTTLDLGVNAKWFMHPTDETCDVAVIPFANQGDYEIMSISPPAILTKERLLEYDIGIGDEIYFPSLFSFISGSKVNTPIVRHGNVAMIPAEPIQFGGGFADLYLVEARSIGGISGAPVFVRRTRSIKLPDTIYKSGDGGHDSLCGVGSGYFLLGQMRGHWDIEPERMNDPKLEHAAKDGVNMGIAAIVPASKVMEVLDQPLIRQLRQMSDDALRSAVAGTED